MMRLYTRTEDFLKDSQVPLALALGFFDGIHLGHQKIFQKVLEISREKKLQPAVVTFQQHPQTVLKPELPPPSFITGPQQKLSLLARLGIEVCFFLPFTEVFAQKEADSFVRETLIGQLGMAALCLGYNAHFGRGRKGNPALMNELSGKIGFSFEEIGPVKVKGEPVSSSRIRKLLQAGQSAEAGDCLGRRFSVIGKVVKGQGRGSGLGFPTANIECETCLLLPYGVYPARIRQVNLRRESQGTAEVFDYALEPQEWQGILNYGQRPTFESQDSKPVLEVFLMDFKGDLYGKTLEVSFFPQIRTERPFTSPEALKEQIAQDVRAAREVFSREKAC